MILVVLVSLGALMCLALALAATVALGPFFWVPYVILYAWMRASGLTPRQLWPREGKR